MLQSGALAEMVEDNTPWWQVRIEKQRIEQDIVGKISSLTSENKSLSCLCVVYI